MIYVTHDQVEAMTLGQKIVVLNGGRIEQVGTPSDLYERPANKFVAGFLGSPRMNFFDALLAGEGGRNASVQLAGGARVQVAADVARARSGARVTLGVRPEHLQIVRPGHGDGIGATVALVEYLGDVTLVYVQVEGAGDMVAVKCDADTAPPSLGSRVEIVFPATRAFLFDEEGQVFAPGWVDSTAASLAQRL
jgi:multiple sugar transport system ATP-binding protein